MTADWVKEVTEEVLGGAPVEIGKIYEHPEDGPIQITGGRYWGEHGVSNFWTWKVLATGDDGQGYAGD